MMILIAFLPLLHVAFHLEPAVVPGDPSSVGTLEHDQQRVEGAVVVEAGLNVEIPAKRLAVMDLANGLLQSLKYVWWS